MAKWFSSILKSHFVPKFKVKAMVEGRDRRPELGYKLAMELCKINSDLSQQIDISKDAAAVSNA